MIRVVRWDIDRRHQAVEDLLAMDVDVVLGDLCAEVVEAGAAGKWL